MTVIFGDAPKPAPIDEQRQAQTFLKPPLWLTKEEFLAYVNGLEFGDWIPALPYLHNTGVPSLKQVRRGKAAGIQWAINLQSYYKRLGWHSGPHAIAMPDGIIALADFTKPGVAQSCSNDRAWAIEMLGNYERKGDDFSRGDGARVGDNAAYAIAVIANKVGWGNLENYQFNIGGLHFHRDCRQDHHACPGSRVSKIDMLQRIAAFRYLPKHSELDEALEAEALEARADDNGFKPRKDFP